MHYRLSLTAGIEETANGEPIAELDAKRALRTIRQLLAATFGGYTETATAGGWINDEGRLVEERGRRWIVVGDGPVEQAERIGREVAERIAAALRQAAVVLEVEQVARVAFVAGDAVSAQAEVA